MKICVFGSVNRDLVYQVPHLPVRSETLMSSHYQENFGGKGFNQGLAVARAGVPMAFAGKIGTDGTSLFEVLKDEPCMDTRHLLVDPEVPTGNAMMAVCPDGTNTSILYAGANGSITEEDIDRVLSDYAAGDILVTQNETSNLAYLLRACHEKGILVALTPAPFYDWLRELPEIQYVHWLLLNDFEGAKLTGLEPGEDNPPEKIVKALREKYPETVIIMTLGEDGSLCYDGKNIIRQKAYKVNAIDTTGAGDTFAGNFIAGLYRGLSVPEAMDLGSRASAICCTRLGAVPSIPRIEETENYDAWLD